MNYNIEYPPHYDIPIEKIAEFYGVDSDDDVTDEMIWDYEEALTIREADRYEH